MMSTINSKDCTILLREGISGTELYAESSLDKKEEASLSLHMTGNVIFISREDLQNTLLISLISDNHFKIDESAKDISTSYIQLHAVSAEGILMSCSILNADSVREYLISDDTYIKGTKLKDKVYVFTVHDKRTNRKLAEFILPIKFKGLDVGNDSNHGWLCNLLANGEVSIVNGRYSVKGLD